MSRAFVKETDNDTIDFPRPPDIAASQFCDRAGLAEIKAALGRLRPPTAQRGIRRPGRWQPPRGKPILDGAARNRGSG